MIRLAAFVPVLCSVCFNQRPEVRHVDCDAATDRGWYAENTDLPVAIENIVVCEDCAREIGNVIGMTDDAELKAENAALSIERDTLRRERDKAQEYADRLEDVFDHRPEPIKIDHRRKPRERTSA